MLNPPPVKYPVPQNVLGFPLDAHLPSSEGVAAWRAPSQRSAAGRGLTTPPPTLAPSSQGDVDSDYPTPIRCLSCL